MARKVQPDNIRVNLDVNATKAQEEIHKLTKSTEALRKQNAQYRKDISALAATEGDHSKEIARLNEQISANTDQIKQNKREISSWEREIDTSYKTAAQLKKHLKELKTELANTSRNLNPQRYRELEAEIKKTEKAYKDATRESKGFLGGIFSMQKAIEVLKGFFIGLGMILATQIIGQFRKLPDIIIDFERANSKLAAVLGTNIEGIARLTEQAKFLGRTTTATASEVTGLQTELAKLGFTQEVIEKMTPATLKFAKAVDTDLSSAAAFAGAALRMFNKDASDAEELMATFAVATTRSALDFHKLEASLATVGPVANAFGFSVEETTALLGILSNAGFEASSAATATRNIILNLCDANGDLAQALGQPVKNLDDLVAGLHKLDSEGVNLAKVLELTDTRSVAAFSSFLQGSDSLLELRDAITGATDDFNQMADTMADNAFGSAKGFDSAVEGLVLKFFDFRTVLKSMFEIGTSFILWLGDVVDALSPIATTFKFLAGQVIDLGAALYNNFIAPLVQLVKQCKSYVIPVINGLIAAWIAYKVAVIASVTWTKLQTSAFAARLLALKADVTWTNLATVATKAFTTALRNNPIGLIATALIAVGTAIYTFIKGTEKATEKTNYLTEATENYKKAMDGIEAKIATERDRLMELRRVAMSELESKEKRIKAINELNRIVPNYNASLDAETSKYKENKEALDDYIISLEKKLRLEAGKEQYKELLKANEKKRQELYQQWKNLGLDAAMAKARRDQVPDWQNYDPYGHGHAFDKQYRELETQSKMTFSDWYDTQNTEQTQALNQFKDYLKSVGLSVEDFAENTTTTITTTATNTANTVVTRIQEIDKELKRLRKINPESDDELDRIQKRIKLLQQEKKELLGNAKHKREAGTYREDSLDAATAPADEEHQRRMLDINKQKPFITEAEYTIKKNQELIRYCGELVAALETLRQSTKETHTQTLDRINQQQGQLAIQVIEAQQAINKTIFQRDRQAHTDRLNSLQDYYEENRIIVARAVVDNRIQQDAANIYLMAQERQLHADQLAELERYYKEVETSDLIAGEDKKKALDEIYRQIREMWSKTVTDAGKWQQTLRELSTNSDSLEGIKEGIDLQIKAVEQTYTAVIEMARQKGLDVTKLEEEKQRRIAALNYQYLEEQYKIQETAGLSWANEYDRDLAKLKDMHRQGLLSEEQFQKARLNLQVKNIQKYYDYYAQLAGSMVSAIQDAEIAQSEAKYDVLIQQAKNNGEETAELEQEKENKKLEIQKKYADLDFAVKISQIIANTAVAIMQAFAQLGPIGGAIAAAMLTATGAAQVVIAKAERDKIKNMQPGNTAGSSATQPAKAERVLSGYADGGYTGDGDRYEVAGVVHRGEYVVPKPIMDNPRVIDAVGTIEAIRRNKILGSGVPAGTPAAGYADGGYASAPPAVDTSELTAAAKELREAARNIRAYVVLRDIENARDTLDRARAPFTRNRQ